MTQGLVLYCDGGCRPINPGPAGWGIHGYLYSPEAPKKQIPNFDFSLTNTGYVSKADIEEDDGEKYVEVTPIHYVDGYGSIDTYASNNVAELKAAINSLRHALGYDITKVQLYTDSEYVRKGFGFYVDKWKKNNWLKSDGVAPANVEYWKELIAERDELIARGVKVKIDWVKGHVEKNDSTTSHTYSLGNVLADKLATIGVIGSLQNNFGQSIVTTAADGYWKYDVNKHPFISNRRLYFNTMSDYIKPGEYYLGEHGKDDDLLGKKISDGAYSVIRLKQPDEMIELIREYQSKLADNVDAIMMIRLDQLYRADTHREISKYGIRAMEQVNKYRLDLSCLDREPLTRELKPPKLAMRAVESVSDLAIKLQKFIDKDPSLTTTDITETIYTVTSKTSKKGDVTVTTKLKPEFNVGFASMPVIAKYNIGNGVKEAQITLTLGIDLVDRNTLKRLESLNPTVTLISWLDSPEMFRYAVVIQTTDDIGIWCGYYSNSYYIQSTES